MDRVFGWIGTLLVAGIFGVLSASSFLGWQHGWQSNSLIRMALDIQYFLVDSLGGPVTGVLFAVAAVAVLWFGFKPKPAQAQAQDPEA